MAAEDWDDHDSYKPEEGENIYDATCKYCGRSGLRWTIGHWHRWELHDWLGTRHWCAEYTAARNAPASANEFLIVPTGDSNMPTTKPTKTKKARKPKAPNYFTIGVRFLKSPSTIYTYKVRKGAKVFLGQELIAPPNQHGIDVVVAVRIDKLPQDTDPSITYKFIERKVSPL